MLRVIIIDDEPMGINTLKVLIERLENNINIVSTTTDPEKGIEIINSFHPDLVFLDINMPKLNGFELIEKLNYKDFKLVFTTAHQEYAIKAIKNKAFDYLLKPIDYEDLKTCIEKSISEFNLTQKTTKHKTLLELSVGDGIVFIKQQDILYIEADGSYSIITLLDGKKHVASRNLKYIEALLDSSIFYRCHQSFIINLKEVKKFISANGTSVKLSDDTLIEVGKNQKDILLDKLKTI